MTRPRKSDGYMPWVYIDALNARSGRGPLCDTDAHITDDAVSLYDNILLSMLHANGTVLHAFSTG